MIVDQSDDVCLTTSNESFKQLCRTTYMQYCANSFMYGCNKVFNIQ